MQGHGLPPPQELWSYQSRLSSLLKLAIRRCVWLVFVALPIQSLTDPCLGSFSIVHLKEHPGWGPTLRSVPQACDGPASLLSSCQCWPVGGREAMGMAPPATRDATVLPWFHGCPAFLCRHFPQSPPSHPLSAVKSSPRPGIAPQSLGICAPVRGMYGFSKDCLILIPFRLPQSSCLTLNLKCFSSDSGNCPDRGIGPLLQFPHPLRAGPVLLRLLFSL